MKTLYFVLSTISVFLSTSAGAQQQTESQMLSTCVACHGDQGVSPNDLWPNLAGQKKGYLLNQLKEFKSGARKNELMSPIAKMLTDKQMEWLAVYYSEIGKD